MNDDQPTLADRMMAARTAAGLNPDKRPATQPELVHARALKDATAAGSEEHDRAEAILAAMQDRAPKPYRADQRESTRQRQ